MVKYESSKVVVKPSEIQGLGVFSALGFQENEVVEVAPVIHYEEEISQGFFIENYAFRNIGLNGESLVSVVLGYGSLYNHSFSPNVEFIFCESFVEVVALRKVSKGEELLVNYGEGFWVGLEDKMV